MVVGRMAAVRRGASAGLACWVGAWSGLVAAQPAPAATASVAPATLAAPRSAVAAPAATTSPAVLALVRWAVGGGDAGGRPFAVVDKLQARLHVFAADGQLRGSAPALLGLSRGDQSAPGVGNRVRSGIAPQHRTTPAGRFASEPGHNLRDEALVWVDYDAAVAIHRLRPADPAERRPQRLLSDSPDDNRISLGCIVVDGSFYDQVVAPGLGRQRGVVYVLPDSGDWTMLFSAAAGV